MPDSLVVCTEIVLKYREMLRHVWNAYFYSQTFKDDWIVWERLDLFRQFESIGTKIIYSEVMAQNTIDIVECLYVRPAGVDVPIHIQRSSTETAYWDHPVEKCSVENHIFKFRNFFDWRENLRDFEYCRLEILEAKENEAITGLEALLKVPDCEFFIKSLGQNGNS